MRTLTIILLFACAASAQISSGGSFAIAQATVAGGGNKSASGAFTVEGTSAQSAAGSGMNGGLFTVYSGFWTPAPLAPTAANVGISGRILTADEQGIRGVYITLLGADGVPQTAISSSMGYYSFSEVPVGDVYLLTVSSKRYVFPKPTIVVHVVDEVTNLDFIAAP